MANLLLTEHPRIWTYQYQLPLRPIEPFLVLSLAGLADLTLHSYITNIERTIRNSKFPGTLHFPRNPIHQIDVQSAQTRTCIQEPQPPSAKSGERVRLK